MSNRPLAFLVEKKPVQLAAERVSVEGRFS